VFLSTDSGGVGLNLQNASVVINCDLPWNPAKLEQRIARAWRKNQTRPVTVLNLIAEDTIEHRMLGTLAAKRGLADGVLDRIGDLREIKLKRGGQAFLSKLELMIAPFPPASAKQSPLAAMVSPADPAAAFAQHAAQLIGTQLVACEERFPDGESSSVLVVVVDRDAATWGERLKPLYEKLFENKHPGSPENVRLEVIDRSTQEAIRRLCEAGLLQLRIRATRHLHPKGDMFPVVLSDEERVRVDSHRVRCKRKLKLARILAAEELLDEARDAVGEAILNAARANAVQARLPEPERLEETILPPLAVCWAESRSLIQRFLAESNHELGSIIEALDSSLAPTDDRKATGIGLSALYSHGATTAIWQDGAAS
jgi:helicase-like protein